MGRQGRLALADLRACVKVGGIVKQKPHAVDCFNNLKCRLKAQTINARELDDVVYVFTDEACEPDGDAFRYTVEDFVYHKISSVAILDACCPVRLFKASTHTQNNRKSSAKKLQRKAVSKPSQICKTQQQKFYSNTLPKPPSGISVATFLLLKLRAPV